MKVTLITIGSRGDVQPYIALGCGLKEAGYHVQLATHYPYQDFVTGYGLDFFPLPMDPQTLLTSESGQAWLDTGTNPIPFFKRVIDIALPHRDEMLAALTQSVQGSDALVYSTVSIFGFHLGQAMGIPAFAAPLQPMWRTRAFPSLLSPEWLKLGPTYNKWTHIFVDFVLWQAARSFINTWRVGDLGLPPIKHIGGPFAEMYEKREPYIYAFSPSVIPKPPDWPEWHYVTGYWFLDRPETWRPPDEVLSFLEAGPPPVYIGFGSMVGRNPAELTEIALEALERSGQRGIFLSGWGGLEQTDLPETILKLSEIPHDWLFPRVAAVVHHGGAGTTAAGLRAGIPTIICPFFADQPFWGKRIAALGVGPDPIPQTQLSAEALAQAITLATGQENIRRRAFALGRAIQAEDGVAQAVRVLRHHLKSLKSRQ